jgi:uncharacterized protein (TIGR03437 family)
MTATIEGVGLKPEELLYVGGAPGMIWGLAQVNLVIPASVTPGNAVPMVINIGGVATQANVTIAVK